MLDLIDLLNCFALPAVPGCEAEDVNQDGTVNVRWPAAPRRCGRTGLSFSPTSASATTRSCYLADLYDAWGKPEKAAGPALIHI